LFYLGSMGSNCSKFQRALGYELNPYHVRSYRSIENASLMDGCVTYNLKGSSSLRYFHLFPQNHYRYLPAQLLKYAMTVRAPSRTMSNVFVSTTEPMLERSLMRLPPPPLSIFTSDVRFIACNGDFNDSTHGEGLERSNGHYIWDVPGYDTYYSRFARVRKRAEFFGMRYPMLYSSFQEASGENPTSDIWLVTSQHVDPVRVVLVAGTHYSYWLDSCPVGSFYFRYGSYYSVISEESSLNTVNGTVAGVRNVVALPGGDYRIKRDRIPLWAYLPRYYLHRSPYVLIAQCLTSDPGSVQRTPVSYAYAVSPHCSSECISCLVNCEGDSVQVCMVDHTLAFAYSFSTVYIPVRFDQFSRIPWQDEFVNDYPESQVVEAPEEFQFNESPE